MIKRIAGRFDVREVEVGKVHMWRPKCIIVECPCGEKPILTRFETACVWCEADHTGVVRGELSARRPERSEAVHH